MKDHIKKSLEESIKVKSSIEPDKISEATDLIINALKKNGKILIFGNGGSASDAQHFAAELIVRFKNDRKSLPAIALTTDTSIITACSNDFNFSRIFERQIEGLANKNDVAIGISTSGNSENVVLAIKKAKEKSLKTITLTGKDGGKLNNLADITIKVPSENTARIQEAHITILHIICELIDKEFKDG